MEDYVMYMDFGSCDQSLVERLQRRLLIHTCFGIIVPRIGSAQTTSHHHGDQIPQEEEGSHPLSAFETSITMFYVARLICT